MCQWKEDVLNLRLFGNVYFLTSSSASEHNKTLLAVSFSQMKI